HAAFLGHRRLVAALLLLSFHPLRMATPHLHLGPAHARKYSLRWKYLGDVSLFDHSNKGHFGLDSLWGLALRLADYHCHPDPDLWATGDTAGLCQNLWLHERGWSIDPNLLSMRASM